MWAWSEWEDFQHGMYSPSRDLRRVEAARGMLVDTEQFRECATEMVRAWPNAATHNLTSIWTGRRAWLGQATCCYSIGASSVDTRQAWGTLTNGEQRAANAVADDVITTWRREMHDAQTLFRY